MLLCPGPEGPGNSVCFDKPGEKKWPGYLYSLAGVLFLVSLKKTFEQ